MKEIKLYGKNGLGLSALVDDSDFDELNKFRWHVKKHRKTNYAVRSIRINGKSTKLKMHRVILNLTDQLISCDHKDHNGLNNQRNNLRACDNVSNRKNGSSNINSSSKYLGVFISKRKTKSVFVAQIGLSGKSTHIGIYKSECEAAKAYDLKAKEHFGEYANLNFK